MRFNEYKRIIEDTVLDIIKEGYELFDLTHSTFKDCLDYLGFSINIIKNANDVKKGQGTDVTQCDKINKKIDIAENYLKENEEFNYFNDSMCWSVHELFHAWIESGFRGISDTTLKDRFYKIRDINDSINTYPLNLDEWVAFGAQFGFNPQSAVKVIEEKKKMHENFDIYAYDFLINLTSKLNYERN